MAQGLDIEVAAGGVETASQLAFLKSCNCDLAQGFLISQPMHPDHVAALLRSELSGNRLVASGW
jgi:EAL domain-containing protein (putative c-di-GMP-specific phosphodiesterase class I)